MSIWSQILTTHRPPVVCRDPRISNCSNNGQCPVLDWMVWLLFDCPVCLLFFVNRALRNSFEISFHAQYLQQNHCFYVLKHFLPHFKTNSFFRIVFGVQKFDRVYDPKAFGSQTRLVLATKIVNPKTNENEISKVFSRILLPSNS